MEDLYQQEIGNFIYELIVSSGGSENLARVGEFISLIAIVLALYFALVWLLNKVVVSYFHRWAQKSKNNLDDYISESKTLQYASRIIPLILLKGSLQFAFHRYPDFLPYLEKGVKVYTAFVVLLMLISFLGALKKYLRTIPKLQDKPIDGITQAINVVLSLTTFLMAISILIDQDLSRVFAGIGAMGAVLSWVFKDTILGFVGAIQLAANDMVRVGDWVSLPKYGADGDVLEIGITSVKVKNFDNTITTVPTYAMINDSVKNWRGMTASQGRRIKRSITLRPSSINFISQENLDRYKKIQSISKYIDHRQSDIDKHNQVNKIDKSILLNGRNLTNLGLFRKYVEVYAAKHPAISKELTLMCRQLQPNEWGIPLEIYCFSQDKNWVNYEHIMSDIFDHIVASAKYFDLEISEFPKSLKA